MMKCSPSPRSCEESDKDGVEPLSPKSVSTVLRRSSELKQQQKNEDLVANELDQRRRRNEEHLLKSDLQEGKRWSLATIRVALAVYTCSPSAFDALHDLKILQLPCSKVLRKILKDGAEKDGIDALWESL